MTTFNGITPNLVVSDVSRSLAFYRDLLGFSVVATPFRSPIHSCSSGCSAAE